MKLQMLLFVLVFYSFNSIGQLQIGSDIDGEAAGDESGNAVSISSDGLRLAIGAPKNDGNSNSAGQVRIYEWDGNNWGQMGNDLVGASTGNSFGTSVSLSSDGSRVVAGARLGGNPSGGYVQVFDWNGTNWIQAGNDISAESSSDRFGFSVSLSSDGNRLAVGAYQNDGNGSNSGHVRIFEWNGTDWAQLGSDIDGEAAADQSGSAVSLSGNGSHVAIGARLNDDGGNWSGHTRVYNWSGSAWVQVGNDLDGEQGGDRSGGAVSLSNDGSRVIIGAANNSNGGTAPIGGHVRIYEWNGSVWNQLGNDINGEAEGDQSGMSCYISSDGNRVVIGAHKNDGSGDSAGHVRTYEWDGTNWVQVGVDIDGETIGDESGIAVSLSSDGVTLAVGAFKNDGSAPTAGHVRVYDLDAPLPIDLLNFHGEENYNNNLLNWATLSEINNDHFVVEHSIDGANFYTLSQIEGYGNSTEIKQYNYVHKNPPHFLNYYRLKQVDYNGAFQYSEIISIQNNFDDIEVYPNPTFGVVEVTGMGENETIEVYSSLGKKVISTILNNNQFDLSNYPNGVYFIRAIKNGESEIKKVLKK